METKMKEAMETLTSKLKNDSDYFQSWQSNIAMSYLDTESQYKKENDKMFLSKEDKHKIANTAAKNFLDLLCK